MRAIGPAEVAEHAARIEEQGFTVVEDAIEAELLDELGETLHRLTAG